MMSTTSVSEHLGKVRKLYEVGNIPNKIQNGTVPFPEDSTQIGSGIALEFRNVSFKYPDAGKYALRNISFSLVPGQLCVRAALSRLMELLVYTMLLGHCWSKWLWEEYDPQADSAPIRSR